MIFKASDYGIVPGKECGKQLNELMKKMRTAEGEKTVEFTPGIYPVKASSCPKERYCITNTVRNSDYRPGEKPREMRVVFDIKDTKNLTLSGDGAVFEISGAATNAAIVNCENITFEGIEITAVNPDLHEFTVLANTGDTVFFELDSGSEYVKKGDGFFFKGDGYETSFFSRLGNSYFGRTDAEDPEKVSRAIHPFNGVKEFYEVCPYRFGAVYKDLSRFIPGERYTLFDNRRDTVGFFAEKTENLTLRGVKQRYNKGLAFVAQICRGITVEKVEFAPAVGAAKQFASHADFLQICMCSGTVSVTDSVFRGAGDDVINVHGTHLTVSKVNGDEITLKFRHPESSGYLPFNEGDKIEFINPRTLLTEGSAAVASAKLKNEKTVILKLKDIKGAKKGLAVENITLCPDFYFARNKMSKIVTRGILVTTRGKVVIEDNDFENLIMPAVLCSDDARSWYESGRCTDVTIRNNRFGENEGYYIQSLPENTPEKNTVHGKFTIEGNSFRHANGIDIERSEELIFRNNTFPGETKDFVRTVDVNKLEII